MKQILLSTHLYVLDFNDILPYTSWGANLFNIPNWCYTRTTSLTTPDVVELGQLWTYHQERSLYFCPVDPTNTVEFRQRTMRVASYTMNACVSAFSVNPGSKTGD